MEQGNLRNLRNLWSKKFESMTSSDFGMTELCRNGSTAALSMRTGASPSCHAGRAAYRLPDRARMTPFLRKILGMNWVLVFLMYGLLVFGVFMIESAARHLSVPKEILHQYGSAGAYYAAMQKQWILVGSVVYFAVALVDYPLDPLAGPAVLRGGTRADGHGDA